MPIKASAFPFEPISIYLIEEKKAEIMQYTEIENSFDKTNMSV